MKTQTAAGAVSVSGTVLGAFAESGVAPAIWYKGWLPYFLVHFGHFAFAMLFAAGPPSLVSARAASLIMIPHEAHFQPLTSSLNPGSFS